MLRKVIAASLVLVLSVGVAFADEIRGVITKVEGGKVTFAKMEGRGKDAKKGEEMTLPVAKDVKVVGMKYNKETMKAEVGDPVEGGLKHKMFANIGERGVRGVIVTDASNKQITEIRVMGGRRPKKQ
jgi:hypothetical protein